MVAVRVEVQENAQRLKARKALTGSRWFYLLTGQTKGRRLTAAAGSPERHFKRRERINAFTVQPKSTLAKVQYRATAFLIPGG